MSFIRVSIVVTVILFMVAGTPAYTQPLKPDVDYVQGEVLITLDHAHMVTKEQVSISPPLLGIEALDRAFERLEGKRLGKLIPTYSKYRLEAGRWLERTFVFEYGGSADARDVVEELSRLPGVESVRLNRILRFEFYGSIPRKLPPPESKFDDAVWGQWYLDSDPEDDPLDKADIDAPEAWYIETGDPDVIVGIFDSGTMLDTCDSYEWGLHSDFNYHFNEDEDLGVQYSIGRADLNGVDDDDPDDGWIDNVIGINVLVGGTKCSDPEKAAFYKYVPSNWWVADPLDPYLCDVWVFKTHGVCVAGVAIGKFQGPDLVGIAPDCQVYFGVYGGIGTSSKMAAAIEHLSTVTKVVNMSFGCQCYDEDVDSALVTGARENDCVFTAATGNTQGDPVSFPANHPDVMAVGAITYDAVLTDYSQWTSGEEEVDVVAPVDEGIFPGNDHNEDCEGVENYCGNDPPPPCNMIKSFDFWAGTSFAAPQAAGIAALIRSRFPDMSQDEVRERIKKSAVFYWDKSSPTDRQKYGAGKVNAYRALTEFGVIDENTTWGASAGTPDTMYVSGDLVIDEGVVLTIDPGTVVKVACEDAEHDTAYGEDPDRVEIIVRGELEIGTGTGQVIFESHSDAPASDDWAGIRWMDGTSAHIEGIIVRNASPAIISDEVDFENEDSNPEKYVYLNTSLSLTDTLVVPDTTSLYILGETDVTVQSGSSIKIDVLGTFVSKGNETMQPIFTSSMEYGNDWIGIVLQSSSADNVIDNTVIKHTQTAVLASGTDVSIESTDFYSGVIGVQVDQGTVGSIDDCTITSHPIGIVNVGCSGTVISGCQVTGSTTFGIYCMNGANNDVTANTIQNCNAGLYCSASSPVVEWNTFSNNTVAACALNNANPDLGNGAGGSVGNNSITNSSVHHVVNLNPSITIKAENNWWGSANGPKSTKFSGAVDYTPWLTSPPGPPPGMQGDPGDRPDDEPVPEYPDRFALSPNYPNPFNPGTSLKYDVPESGGMVKIAIYDVQGRLVRTLVDEFRGPGTHSIEWDGKDRYGNVPASGVYFVQMKVADFAQTRKLILLR